MAKVAKKPRSPVRRLMKMLGVVAFVFLLAIGGSAFFSWRLSTQPPEWWRPVDPKDPQVDRAARSIENGISDQIHRVRPATPPASTSGSPENPAADHPQTWTIVIKETEANAWLAARLGEWLLNRNEKLAWPSNASQPQVAFDDGVVRLGFEVTDAGKARVISASLAPNIDNTGALWLPLNSLSIGRLPLPGSMVAEAGSSLLESRLPPEMKDNPDTKNFIQALANTRALTDKAIAKLSDGRKVQIVRITPRKGELEVECRTLPR
jgi:hypothetical protein